MRDWVKDKIGNYSTSVPGYAFDSDAFKTEGIPVIKITNVKNGYIDLEESSTEYVDEHYTKSLNEKYQVRLGDIIVSLTGSHLTQPNSVVGRVGRYRQKNISLLNQRAAKIEAIKFKCDNGFLYYLLSTNTLRKEIALLAHGAANQANVSHKDIEKIKVFFPPLLIQKKIVAILSAYDDLIENNNRRITILEKMAEELYREWFVRLRFPGHEKVKIVKGVPEGWEIKRIGEVLEYYIGGGWGEETASLKLPIGAYVIRGTDLPMLNSGIFEKGVFRFHKESNYETRNLIEGDIIFEVSGGSKDQLLGRTLFVSSDLLHFFENKVICASFCKLIRTNKDLCSPFFLKYFFKSYYDSGLVGTYQIQSTGISNYQFEDFLKYQKIVLPDKIVLDEFEAKVKPILENKGKLSLANERLRIARDRLLSRLMSGKIDVENMNIQFPASMQYVEPIEAQEEFAHA